MRRCGGGRGEWPPRCAGPWPRPRRTVPRSAEAAPVVERVGVTGTQHVPPDTLLFYVSTKRRRPLRRDAAAGRLPAAVGHRVPRRPAARRARRARRQGRHLRGPRAQAHPDRGLPRREVAHHLRHRGRAQGEGGRAPHRQLLRPGEGAPRGGDHQGDAGREGPALRHRPARRQVHRPRRAAGLVRGGRGAAREGQARRLRSATRSSPTATCAGG